MCVSVVLINRAQACSVDCTEINACLLHARKGMSMQLELLCCWYVHVWLIVDCFFLSLCASESWSSSEERKDDEELVVRRLLDRAGYVPPVPGDS